MADETKPSETKPSETKPSETKPSETKPSETKAATPTKTRVRALARGYFDGAIIEAGEQFDINHDGELGSWMEPVNKADAERLADRMKKLRKNRPPPPISKSVPPTPAVRIR